MADQDQPKDDRPHSGSDLIQVTLNLTRSLIREVGYLAAVKKCSRTQAIADAITLAVYFDRVVRAGGQVLVKRRGSETVQIDLVLDHTKGAYGSLRKDGLPFLPR